MSVCVCARSCARVCVCMCMCETHVQTDSVCSSPVNLSLACLACRPPGGLSGAGERVLPPQGPRGTVSVRLGAPQAVCISQHFPSLCRTPISVTHTWGGAHCTQTLKVLHLNVFKVNHCTILGLLKVPGKMSAEEFSRFP